MLDRVGLHAGISYDTTGAVITQNGAVGCQATYTGVGDSDVNLDVALDNADMCLLATIRGANIGSVRFVNTSDTVKQLICRDEAAGALAAGERPIDVLLLKLSAIDRKFVQAAGHFQGSAAGAAVAFGERGGVVARTAAGIYTITLDKAIDAQQSVVVVTPGIGAGAATDLHPRIVHTSDTIKTVTIETLAAGADVDADFCWAVFSLLDVPNENCLGMGSIAAAGGTVIGRGCVPARNGAGDYQYTLYRQSAVGSHVALASVIGATGHAIRIAEGAVGRKDVETQVQAAAAQNDSDNNAIFLRLN